MNDLLKMRKKIDQIDDQMIALLLQRLGLVRQMGKSKKDNIYTPVREVEIVERLSKKGQGLLPPDVIAHIYREIFSLARLHQRLERVAYLGPEGTFSQQAALNVFGHSQSYVPVSSIRGVFDSVRKKQAAYGVVPIESNTDGTVGETLDQLGDPSSPLKIIRDIRIDIHLAFATHATSLTQVRKIYSKDKAFGQCRRLLNNSDLERAEHIFTESTAKAAQLAAQDATAAALCSDMVAEKYALPVLYKNIEDFDHNQTRFIVIGEGENPRTGKDHTTLLARIPDKPGALLSFLKDFKDARINLTKIESRPMREKRWGYLFYLDCEGHRDDKAVARILAKHKKHITWLGSYPQERRRISNKTSRAKMIGTDVPLFMKE